MWGTRRCEASSWTEGAELIAFGAPATGFDDAELTPGSCGLAPAPSRVPSLWQSPPETVLSRAETLTFALAARLREVLGDEPATEAELRSLSERAEASARVLDAQIHASERRLRELAAEPGSDLSDYAEELRRVDTLRPELAELQMLLTQLETRARELRTNWLRRQAGSINGPRRD